MKTPQTNPKRFERIRSKLHAMRYGVRPKSAKGRRRNLSKQLGLTIDCTYLAKISVAQRFEPGGIVTGGGGEFKFPPVKINMPDLLKPTDEQLVETRAFLDRLDFKTPRDIAFITPYNSK